MKENDMQGLVQISKTAGNPKAINKALALAYMGTQKRRAVSVPSRSAGEPRVVKG
jgi:hypothetical protein